MTSVPPPRPLASAGVGVIRAALVVRLLDEWWSYLPAGSIDDQVTDLGLDYGQSALLLALLTVGGLLGSPVAALADRGHRRLLATAGALTIAAGLAAFALSAPFPVLVGAAIALGAASDVMIRPLESALADAAEESGGRLDRLLGHQHLITWAGDLIAPALLAVGAATALGWRGVFALTAVAFVAFAAVLAATSFPTPPVGASNEASLLRSARTLLRTPEVWLLAGAEAIMLTFDEAFLGFAVARAADESGGAAAQSLAVGLVVGGVTGALIIARRGLDRRIVGIGSVLLAAGVLTAATRLPIVAQVVALAAAGAGTAVLWAKVHHRSLTLAPRLSATVPTVVSLLSTPAILLVLGMGAIADAASITWALVGAAALSVPLALVVRELGGDVVAPDDLD